MRLCPIPLKVLCIICICWASLGILLDLGSMAFYFVPTPSSPPELIAMKKEVWYIVNTFGMAIIGVFLNLLLLWGAIKSLTLEKSGRKMLLGYVWGRPALSAVALIYSFGFIMPRTMDIMMKSRPMPAGMETGMRIGMYMGACGAILFSIALPAYILITLRLRSVRDAYEGLFDAKGSFEINTPPPQG